MRILIVITGLGTGGAERLVSALADRFVEIGHDVMLVSLQGAAEMSPTDSRVVLKSLGMRRSLAGVPAAMWRLRRLVHEFRPDVVNSHLFHANVLMRVLRLVISMPRLVTSAHNTNEGGHMRMLLYRFTDRLANISTNVSEEAVEAFEQQRALPPGRMVTIYNGVDTERFYFDDEGRGRLRGELRVDEATPMLLAIGRLSEQKDYPNLLHAFASLETGPVAPRLVIVGDGPLREELDALANSLGIGNRVDFLGLRRDVRELMSACDLYVMSSAWEGLPMVMLEAMACERLAVATDCGGISMLVGDTGLIAQSHNSAALASALEEALGLPPRERERLGKAARERVVARFSVEAMADRYLTVYRVGKQDDPEEMAREQW